MTVRSPKSLFRQVLRQDIGLLSRIEFSKTQYPVLNSADTGDKGMAVIAKFIYEVKPGRMVDFMAKLKQAAGPKFSSPVMPKSFRLFRSTVPGPDTGTVVMLIEYEDMAAYGSRTAFENSNKEWKELFAAAPDAPEKLLSVELLTEFGPADAV